MGLDASIVFTTKSDISLESLQGLSDVLRYNFYDIFGKWDYKREGPQALVFYSSFYDPEEMPLFDIEGKIIWSLTTYCRYYSEGYERGPGLEIGGILLVLLNHPDVIDVLYGGNDWLGFVSEADAIAIIKHWAKDGRTPITKAAQNG